MTDISDNLFHAGDKWIFIVLKQAGAPLVTVDVADVDAGEATTVDVLVDSGVFKNTSEILRLMRQNAITMFAADGSKVGKIKENRPLTREDFDDAAFWGTKKERFGVFLKKSDETA